MFFVLLFLGGFAYCHIIMHMYFVPVIACNSELPTICKPVARLPNNYIWRGKKFLVSIPLISISLTRKPSYLPMYFVFPQISSLTQIILFLWLLSQSMELVPILRQRKCTLLKMVSMYSMVLKNQFPFRSMLFSYRCRFKKNNNK